MIKKRFFVIILVFFLVFYSKEAYSFGIGGLGESDFEFQPNLETELKFVALHRGSKYALHLEGPLSEYATLTEPVYVNDDTDAFSVIFKFPESVDYRGKQEVKIVMGQDTTGSKGLGVALNIKKKIKINVPLYGKYVLFDLSSINANVGETIDIGLIAKNLGEDEVEKAYGVIDILNIYNETILTLTSEEKRIKSRERIVIYVPFNTTGYEAGNYRAEAILYWDDNQSKKDTAFKIGDLDVKILNYTKEVVKGEINNFNISVESGWNSRINNIYAEVKINENGNTLTSFSTPPIKLEAWEKSDLSSFLDARNLEAKEYDAEITVNYEGASTTGSGKVKVVKKFDLLNTTNLIILLVAVIVILVFVNIFVFMRRKDSGYKGKVQKKRK